MSDEITRTEPAAPGSPRPPGEPPKDGTFFPALLSFLSTEAGKGINHKIAEWVGSLREGQQQAHTVELVSTVARYLLMAGIIGAAVWLQHEKQLDSAVTGLLGLALGYLFGRQKSQE